MKIMNFVGPACGFVTVLVSVVLMAAPLIPFFWVNAEAAANPGRWMVSLAGLAILWMVVDVYLTEKYVGKHGCLPPDYLS